MVEDTFTSIFAVHGRFYKEWVNVFGIFATFLVQVDLSSSPELGC